VIGCSPRPTRDPALPHQIVIVEHAGMIAMSCNCMYSTRGGGCYEPIEARRYWRDPRELLYLWRQHIERGAVAA